VVGDLDARLRQLPRPPGYEFEYGGEYEEQQQTFRDLTFAAILRATMAFTCFACSGESLSSSRRRSAIRAGACSGCRIARNILPPGR